MNLGYELTETMKNVRVPKMADRDKKFETDMSETESDFDKDGICRILLQKVPQEVINRLPLLLMSFVQNGLLDSISHFRQTNCSDCVGELYSLHQIIASPRLCLEIWRH